MIGIAMGEKGFISRVLCAKFGGFLTFGSVEAGAISAPGQQLSKNCWICTILDRLGLAPKCMVL